MIYVKRLRSTLTAALPAVATLLVIPFAHADSIVAHLSGPGSTGSRWYDCDLTGGGGKRAHVQATAVGETAWGDWEVAYSVQTGTSQSASMPGQGARHVAFLESHLLDFTNGNDITVSHCSSGFKSWGTSTSCSDWVRASAGEHSGVCEWWWFTAQSTGVNN